MNFFHIVNDIAINIRYRYSSASLVICFICVVYDIVYQILNVSSQISKIKYQFHCHRMKKTFLIIIYKCSAEDLDQHMNFWYLSDMGQC